METSWKRKLTALLLAGIAYVGGAAQTPQQELNVFVEYAKVHSLPLGIILPHDSSLCKLKPADVESLDSPESLQVFLTRNNYVLQSQSGLVLTPSTPLPTPLQEVLHHKFKGFPPLSGTMFFMAGVLNGWAATVLDPKKGFVIDELSAPQAQNLSLSGSFNQSVQEIAAKIVALGGKGLWTLKEEGVARNGVSIMKLEAYSYTDDYVKLQSLRCDQ